MQLTKYSLLVTIGKVIEKYGQNYSYASTKTILELLSKYTKINICKRTYYQHMRDLRDEGLIKSQRRYGREPDGKIYNRTSAVCITIKGYVQLALRGWKWAVSMAKKLRKKFIPQKNETAPEIIKANKIEEKKEADTLKYIAQKVRQEGISLYEYLLKKGKTQPQLTNRITASDTKT